MRRYELIGPDGPTMFQIIAPDLESAHATGERILETLNKQSPRNAESCWRVELAA